MSFKKGTSGNPAGRPKKATTDIYKIRKALAEFWENNASQLQKDLNSLSPKERIEFFMRCADFIVPKLSRNKLYEEQEKSKPFLRSWVITPVQPADIN